jgi:HEPN domain-containing protein
LAWQGAPDGPFGFREQQTVEKLLKALLSQHGIEYKRTHDLSYLVTLLATVGEALPSPIVDFARMERFAVVHRYDEVPEVEILDRPEIVETVRQLREHIEGRIAVLSQ